jgi:hypothetical protein
MEAEWDAQRADRERARLARQERFDEERSNARITGEVDDVGDVVTAGEARKESRRSSTC